MNNTRYAHKTKQLDIESFYKIIYGTKQIKTKQEKQDFEAWYFAMCLLLPKDSFLQRVEHLGGMDMVISHSTKKIELASYFHVEPKLVTARIKDLLSQEKQKQSELKKIKKYNNLTAQK